jgi:hypothetical protein
MKIVVFNLCLLLGWSLIVAGGVLYSLPFGLIIGGVFLVAFSVLAASLAGGIS